MAEPKSLPNPESIHRLRISLKRLRAKWRLAGWAGETERASRERRLLREAVRRLAKERDAQVVRRLRREYLRGKTSAKASGPGNESAGITVADFARIEKLIRDSEGRLPSMESGDRWKRALARMYRRAGAKKPDSAHSRDIRFHAWRKAVKELGYALETWPSGKTGYLRKLGRSLDRLQKGLGEAHDLALLEKTVLAERGSSESASGPDMGKVARRKKKIARKCLEIGARSFILPQREFRKRLD